MTNANILADKLVEDMFGAKKPNPVDKGGKRSRPLSIHHRLEDIRKHQDAVKPSVKEII